ncbi:MAG TPA: hypothetical protein VF092_27320 [Longimicrobium sp.]
MSDEISIDHETFGRLAWDEDFWYGRVTLPGWAGFRVRLGTEEDLEDDDGTAILSIEPGMDEPSAPPSEAQARAFLHLVRNEAAVTHAVQRAILAEYPKFRKAYGRIPEAAARMPRARTIADLQPLIGLVIVHVVRAERDGMAYVGFELGCSWDEEHGVGVMTHAGRIVEVGHADIGFSVFEDETAPIAPPARWWEFWKT